MYFISTCLVKNAAFHVLVVQLLLMISVNEVYLQKTRSHPCLFSSSSAAQSSGSCQCVNEPRGSWGKQHYLQLSTEQITKYDDISKSPRGPRPLYNSRTSALIKVLLLEQNTNVGSAHLSLLDSSWGTRG